MAKNDSVTVAVSTVKGAYLLRSGDERKEWKHEGPILSGESVNNITADSDGNLFAATLTEGVFSSEDSGRTWKSASRGLHVRKVWSIEADRHENGLLYAGTQYGHLFKSPDSGKSWEEVTGLHNAPLRNEWGVDWAMGTTGLTIHTIKSDPTTKGRVYIVSSGAGPYRSDDSGDTWQLLRDGVAESCPVGTGDGTPDIPGGSSDKQLEDHLREVHRCSHKLALSSTKPGTLYQQNHCGVFSSSNAGSRWNDISPAPNARHGFPIAFVEGKKDALFVIPAYQGECKQHNSCIQNELKVNRSYDSGKHWELLSNGLPTGVHNCVLRDGMAHDTMEEPGIYFGTTTGEVFGSTDYGDTWATIATGLGRIQGISALAL